MPKSNILKSIPVVLFGALFGYSSMKFFMPEQKNRHLASQSLAKLGQDQNSRNLFDIEINTDELAKTENDISTIKVKITALQNLSSGLVYNWHTDASTEIIDGQKNDILGNFLAGETKEYSLRVKFFSKQLKKYISFEVQGDVSGTPLKREVLISSRIEDSFEYTLQQNEKRNTLLNNKLGLAQPKSKFDAQNVVR